MGWRYLSLLLVLVLLVAMVGVYLFLPLNIVEFNYQRQNSNFSLDSAGEISAMQFYENMRFPSRDISYRIENCPLQRTQNMNEAFATIEENTIINFYPVIENEDIYVTCDNTQKVEGGLFIAGEGGPSNITQTDLFNVITKGQILLIRDSKCPTSNIAIHELLHVLGFDHSNNENNIMYPVSNCRQTIGDDTIDLLNQLYAIESYSDLAFVNVTATLQRGLLNTEISVVNQGLVPSEPAEIVIYGDDEEIKRISLNALEVGYGRIITLQNVWAFKRLDSVRYEIESNFEEIDKTNNKITLVVN